MVTSAGAPLASRPQPGAGSAEDAGGACGEGRDDRRQRDASGVRQGHEGAERRLEAADAVGGGLVLAELVGRRVRGVVGGDGVDRAIGEPFDHGLDVPPGPQRRVDLGVGVVGRVAVGGSRQRSTGESAVAANPFVGEGEMVGGHLGGDGEAALLGAPHDVEGAERAHVGHVGSVRR